MGVLWASNGCLQNLNTFAMLENENVFSWAFGYTTQGCGLSIVSDSLFSWAFDYMTRGWGLSVVTQATVCQHGCGELSQDTFVTLVFSWPF